jgi:WD40 repeat protein
MPLSPSLLVRLTSHAPTDCDIRTHPHALHTGHEDGVVKIKWHPQEPLLFSCSTDRTIRLWDARAATQVRSWVGHQDMILDFDISR